MNKKITISIMAALMIAGLTSIKTFAAMQDGSVVVGNKAFDINYINDPANADEFGAEIYKGGEIYVKNFSGKWIDNVTGLEINVSLIPAVTYKNATGITYFDANDKDQVVDGTQKVTAISLNKPSDTLTVGGTDTLTSTISPSNASNKAITWTSSNNNVATVNNGVVTAVASGTTVITATTVDGSKIASCTITVNNEMGYVHNTLVDTDLNVRASANLNGTILGHLYNYVKIEILGTTVDASGNLWDKINYNSSIAYVYDPYIQHYTSPPENVVSIAVNITKKFEVDNTNQVAGNSDGQGLSLGYLQWCIRQGTLQPILNRMDREHNEEMKSIFGANYNIMYNMTIDTLDNQIKWSIGINDSSNKISEPWNSMFVTLCNNVDFKNIEADAEVYTVKQAMFICDKYKLNTVRGFALAFDIANQNGSISSGAIKIIDDSIAKAPNMTEKSLLLVIANAVADNSETGVEDTRVRKLAIVNGQGTVHGFILNLDDNYGLNDNYWR